MTSLQERLRERHDSITENGVTLYREAADALDAAEAEIARLEVENWQLKGTLGYPVPGNVPPGNFKCGLCEASAQPPAVGEDVVELIEFIEMMARNHDGAAETPGSNEANAYYRKGAAMLRKIASLLRTKDAG